MTISMDFIALLPAGDVSFDTALASVRATLATLRHEGNDVRMWVRYVLGSRDPSVRALHRRYKDHATQALFRFVTGDPEGTRAALLLGADPNAENEHGHKPLYYAAEAECWDVVTALLASGADVAAIDMDSATSATVIIGLVCLGIVPIHAVDREGKSPLHYLALEGSYDDEIGEHMDVFLARGADVHATDAMGLTPLHFAVGGNCVRGTLHLLAVGANVNARDDLGNTPLHSAVHWNYFDQIEILLKHPDVDVHAVNEAGRTPLLEVLHRMAQRVVHFNEDTRCFETDGIRTIEALMSRGAQVNLKDLSRNTPLHYAALINSYDVVCLLLRRCSVHIIAKDAHGMTPFERAVLRYGVRGPAVMALRTAYLTYT